MKKRTITQQKKIWAECLSEASRLLDRSIKIRMKIADLAIKACDIRQGGGGHWDGFANQYTLKAFAEELGLNRKTLYNWVATRKVFTAKVLSEMDLKKVKYDDLSKTGEIVRRERIKDTKVIKDLVKNRGRITSVYNKIEKPIKTLEYHAEIGSFKLLSSRDIDSLAGRILDLSRLILEIREMKSKKSNNKTVMEAT